jgi:hypothetical protein
MAILCDFKPVGIEGMSQWRVVASCSKSDVGSGLRVPNIFINPLNQQLPHNYKGETMTDKDDIEKLFPQEKQIGGNHYKNFKIQPYEFF